MKKIILRLKGGIGNQLFSYSTARRLAFFNNAELVLDDVTGFTDDHMFNRKFQLHHFKIKARKATPKERLEPFSRYKRKFLKLVSRRMPFEKRFFLEEENTQFDKRIMTLKVEKTLYFEGYWQYEDYFKDIEKILREELQIIPPTDPLNQRLANRIRNKKAIAIHVRWFDPPVSNNNKNILIDYYKKAIKYIESKISEPYYFIFSDYPHETSKMLGLPRNQFTLVSNNKGDESAYADLWLMAQCKHFIISNSTFSWWGAWLTNYESKIVISPNSDLIEY